MRCCLALVVALCGPVCFAEEPTVAEDAAAKKKLLGEHVFNLQWIDTPPGTAVIEDRGDGALYLRAEQRSENKGNFATIEGKVLRVSKSFFTVEGEIVTRVDYLAGGKPCARSGTWTFRITGKRAYYRLKEMENPCEGQNTVDYLDIYIATKKGSEQPSRK